MQKLQMPCNIKEQIADTGNKMYEAPKPMLSQEPKIYKPHDSMYTTFWKRQN